MQNRGLNGNDEFRSGYWWVGLVKTFTIYFMGQRLAGLLRDLPKQQVG